MAKWIHAPDVPKSWEGTDVWQWTKEGGVTIRRVPESYSREPHHCGGIWFTPLLEPNPPINAPDSKD